ncbi:Rha family transcriptional regulator [Limosilactobacillus reuteri]|uniref:Rha family transcriptional regulator n=2 Tax=Limosilactobacillus reuteri TaxID=1598 RepID=A0A855Y081_LIMRT|nr:phage regulatory protein/antirepressor Ant [Limosilactobacillus reuteri]PWT35687.1 Rha family transcriptional regulator [Limosilactobacillus reuteri]PWT39428.1 Rha family transcriptional regulator [Limosilactobacillus reuteri]PWT55188.1 Rha family transcriptional regulator [Limosilactobacillus reuteri]PWT60883.1 Rha family transcriptional regulator [Limosilactobacillus reuteri]PWT65211.1 Rha family transcriptional regulator [Limosilactobacillus reuteri]
MNEPQLLIFQGEPALDSREVAKMIGKLHKNLMRDIHRYINDLTTSSKLSPLDFFIGSNYKDAKGEIRDCYLLTKMGCEFVANKMTGKKGTLFTAQYVSLFNEYQASLKKPDSYTIDDPVKRAERWIEERKAYEALVPKGQYFDSQMRNPGTMTVTEIAKDYGMTATKLNRLLHEFGVQFKQGKHWVLYHKYDGKGYTQYEPFAYNDNKGVHNNLKWTQRGRKFIYDTLKGHGILPVLEQPELLPEVNAVD